LTAKANPEAVTFRDNLKNRINLLENQIKRLKSTFSNLTKFEFVDELRRLSLYLKQLDKVLDALEKQELPTKDFLITIVKPITNIPILPQDIFIPGKISNEISLKSCPGEYEPSSFVISAFSEISCLSLEITDLKSSKDFIPAKNVNIKAVKCWYQARTAWTGVEQNKTKRILVPDLLINDDNLLQVDMSQQENYLKVITSDGGNTSG
jgi:hypothetical protein